MWTWEEKWRLKNSNTGMRLSSNYSILTESSYLKLKEFVKNEVTEWCLQPYLLTKAHKFAKEVKKYTNKKRIIVVLQIYHQSKWAHLINNKPIWFLFLFRMTLGVAFMVKSDLLHHNKENKSKSLLVVYSGQRLRQYVGSCKSLVKSAKWALRRCSGLCM